MAPVTTPAGTYVVDFVSTTLGAQAAFTALTTAPNLTALDNDFAFLQDAFSGLPMTHLFPIKVIVSDVGGGAQWSSHDISAGVTISVSYRSDPLFLRYLLASKIAEMFEFEQGLGWHGGRTGPGDTGSNTEGDLGEGLSRFLGRQLLLKNGSTVEITAPAFGVGNQWLATSSRDNFISSSDSPDPKDNQPDPKVGCTTLFINYLHTQLGFSIKDIVRAGAPSLQGVYTNLTRDEGDPFPVFAMLLDAAFPAGPPGSVGTQIDTCPAAG